MKLLDIANRYYLITLVFVFTIGSLGAYYVLKSIINHEFNEKLYAEQAQLVYELRNFENLQRTYYLNIGDVIELEEATQNPELAPVLKDTIMYDQYEKKELPFRMLTFSDEINGKYYIISISKSLLPNLDLIQGVTEIMIGLALILMLALGLLNRLIFQKLWSPFHHIILQLQAFKISHPVPLNKEETDVEEFNQLGQVLEEMISKSIRDYKNLKEYTENTSHEIQTPLAIIKNKAEMLLQEPLKEEQLTEVSKIYEAATRLSRLKDGLSLLTKIENNQYVEAQEFCLKDFLETKLQTFEELMEIKNITLEKEFLAEPKVIINQDLAHILINNLLSNAIKHNVNNGWIKVKLQKNKLTISNSGNTLIVSPEELFERFKRNTDNRESTGLGLSLIKRICEHNNMSIAYNHQKTHHELILSW
ncbi:MAG: hypothetical protein CMB80_24785 [Flammeovirgaceae bacterium]|nr:hypothetical protein [Flammeovirgaceae bacterium]MBE60785.1 hypothetical protein [Flammeovirgaceae bacterium]